MEVYISLPVEAAFAKSRLCGILAVAAAAALKDGMLAMLYHARVE
jgi:hypothetical protein